MKSLEDFVSKNEPKRRASKLKELENEIVQLYEKGYQVEQIQSFLKANKKETCLRNIYYFLKRKKDKPKAAANSSSQVKKSENNEPKNQNDGDLDTDKWLEDTIKKHKK